MKKGVVMEVKKNFVIVLTADGQFFRAKKEEDMDIGSEVVFTPYSLFENISSTITKRKTLTVASAFILLLAIIPTFLFSQNNKVYSYMTIDVNPSMEVHLNKQMSVIDIISYNNDGALVIANIDDWRGNHVTTVIEKIVSESKVQGFLQEDSEILLSTLHQLNTEKAQNETNVIISELSDKLEKEQKVVVHTVHYSKEVYHEANQNEISPGKYVLYKQLTEKSKEPSLEEVKKSTVSQISKLLNEQLPQEEAAEKNNHDRQDDIKSKPSSNGSALEKQKQSKRENTDKQKNRDNQVIEKQKTTEKGNMNKQSKHSESPPRKEAQNKKEEKKQQGKPVENKGQQNKENKGIDRAPKNKDNNGNNQGKSNSDKNTKQQKKNES